jgi:hypothetical protein
MGKDFILSREIPAGKAWLTLDAYVGFSLSLG